MSFSVSGYRSVCWPTLELMRSSNALHNVENNHKLTRKNKLQRLKVPGRVSVLGRCKITKIPGRTKLALEYQHISV